ncbi:GNAT family N-acetyltransferase [Candidatus Nanosalina sp. VS9-1]|uniref:GNAT family N-acetyltransferase n=1 Tax=Candidatus Nanosalina sp. VS9-1 TaxID=3388566 RepID=UPI0039E00484
MDSLEFTDLSYEPGEYSLSDEKMESAVIGMYQRVFNNSPYGENFDYELAEDIVQGIRGKDTEGLLAVQDGMPVGFAWGEVLEPGDREIFPDEIPGEFFDGSSYYFAELGVLPDYRDQGLGKELKRRELEKVKNREDIDKGLMRTSVEENDKKLGLDSDLGFEALEPDGEPVTEEVESVGVEGSDLRGYFWRPV